MALHEVTRDEFFAAMAELDVHPRITNDRWPYTSDWRLRHTRELVGRTVDSVPPGSAIAATTHYLV